MTPTRLGSVSRRRPSARSDANQENPTVAGARGAWQTLAARAGARARRAVAARVQRAAGARGQYAVETHRSAHQRTRTPEHTRRRAPAGRARALRRPLAMVCALRHAAMVEQGFARRRCFRGASPSMYAWS
jgi:hypothetical protein